MAVAQAGHPTIPREGENTVLVPISNTLTGAAKRLTGAP
jgi:hypothetical protein